MTTTPDPIETPKPLAIPQTMRAALLPAYGEAALMQVTTTPAPACGPEDVLVRVKASSVNPIDWKIRQGSQRVFVRLKLPVILGRDVSGVVVAVGARVRDFAVGDEVYAVVDHRRPGTYAEYVAIHTREVAHKPRTLSHEEAASLPLAGLTAWQALFDAGRLEAGQRVLIQAGAGGVGAIALQLARWKGAYVFTTCSARNTELVQELGADVVIDYTRQRFEDVARDLDVLLESVGGDAMWRGLPLIKPGGHHVSIVSDIPAWVDRHGPILGSARAVWELLKFGLAARLRYQVKPHLTVMRTSGAQLATLAKLVDEGHLKPIIDSTFALDDIAAAHERSQTKHARGKIIVVP